MNEPLKCSTSQIREACAELRRMAKEISSGDFGNHDGYTYQDMDEMIRQIESMTHYIITN